MSWVVFTEGFCRYYKHWQDFFAAFQATERWQTPFFCSWTKDGKRGGSNYLEIFFWASQNYVVIIWFACLWSNLHLNLLRTLRVSGTDPQIEMLSGVSWCYWLAFLCLWWLSRLPDHKAPCNFLSKWFIFPVKYNQHLWISCTYFRIQIRQGSLSFFLGQAVNSKGWFLFLTLTEWAIEGKQSEHEEHPFWMVILLATLGSLL